METGSKISLLKSTLKKVFFHYEKGLFTSLVTEGPLANKAEAIKEA